MIKFDYDRKKKKKYQSPLIEVEELEDEPSTIDISYLDHEGDNEYDAGDLL